MIRALVATVAVFFVVAACAPETSDGDGLRAELTMSKAFADQVGGFQFSVIREDGLRPGADVNTCIVNSVEGDPFVRINDPSTGAPKKAVIFPKSVTDGGGTLSGIEVGSEYLFVCEALTATSPPALLATGRVAVTDFDVNPNRGRLVFNLQGAPDGGILDSCDPTIN